MAILAMGGEGGGVLADWCVDMAEHCGYWAQTTSVPGVAQRTGTTIYYLEFFPKFGEPNAEPILSTMAAPGEVDIVIASELMEAGRAVQRGFVTPTLTTFIASTHRVYSMAEKMALGDGRVDSDVLLHSARNAARVFIPSDFAKVAEWGSCQAAEDGARSLGETFAQFESSARRSTAQGWEWVMWCGLWVEWCLFVFLLGGVCFSVFR